jgi:Protoporphyrinogen oxidase
VRVDAPNAKHIVIAGAGPAGLTAAYELLRDGGAGAKVVVVEASSAIGGISQTVNFKGNRMDIGGHRFFSKSGEVMDWWRAMMPAQGAPSADDILLKTPAPRLVANGPDPGKTDRVMLFRRRVSRIFFLRKFFDYPISLKWRTFANMGVWRTLRAGFSYLFAQVRRLPETSLENFYINRFGRVLYGMFFEDYTAKVWGVHPSKLGADWGSQRVKGLSVAAVLKDMFAKAFGAKAKQGAEVETSLIEEFLYPKLGPGQLWEIVADEVRKAGGEIRMEREVVKARVDERGRIAGVDVRAPDGRVETLPCDVFISSMPVKDLTAALELGNGAPAAPAEVARVAAALQYRDFITVGLLCRRLEIRNRTAMRTYAGRVPDSWIYIQERDVKVGRLQVFNNWSPYLVADYENTEWIGLEYFCAEGDELWEMPDGAFIEMAKAEVEKIGIVDSDAVLDAVRVKIKKAYPAYVGAYYELDKVRAFLDSIPNLWCVGRNGQHRYNNCDHSMLTAIEAVRAIKAGTSGKSAVWLVNTEKTYHEK